MPRRLDASSGDFEARFSELLSEKREAQADVNDAVAAILADVRARGDAALLDYTERFDRLTLTVSELRLTENEIVTAREACDDGALEALHAAHDRIVAFHRRQLPDDIDFVDEAGVRLGGRWRAVTAAGLYVPGGTAAYPSSVLMNAVPARVAGVARVAMVVPTPDGKLNPLVLAAADIAGVTEIYRVGGAQAVAALAYGTSTIRSVDKIVGPGNAYVAAAKRQVFGTVGIDMIAGPSEILIVADNSADPGWVAADLLSQAEHDVSAQSILITDDEAFAGAVEAAVERHLQALPRVEIARQSWRDFGAVITVSDFDTALPVIDRIAPEHLELVGERTRDLADRIHNAGAIFIGDYTPEAIGDYVAGPNHVLPTGRTARFSSGLGVLDFMKRSSVIECSADGLRRIGPFARTLAEAEGLDAHALSLAVRLDAEAMG